MFNGHIKAKNCCYWTLFLRGWTVGAHLGQLLGVRIRRLELPPTVSHSAPDSSELTVEVEGGVRFFVPTGVGETTGASFSVFDATTGGRVPGFGSGFFGAFFPGQTAER